MQHYDAIVIGTGGVGSAALFHLARRGGRVLGLDRFSGGHDRGSSHGETRVIRQAYFEHPNYVPLLRRAYELWDELEARTGQRLFHRVGLLEIGPPDGVIVKGVLESARLHQLEVESLSAEELRRRFPGFRLPPGCVAVFERQAGFLMVEQCVLAHLAEAVKCGAETRTDAAVVNWRPDGSGYAVETTAGEFRADRLVITAGSWAGALLHDLGVRFRVLRKHLHWYDCRDSRYRADAGCPTFFYDLPQGFFYGFPQLDDSGVKVAEHTGGTEIQDPLTDDGTPEPLDNQRVESFLEGWMPGVTRVERRHAVCFYTMSPDEHFVIDRHPGHSGVVYTAGLSGHGFKFTSVLGEIMAQLALDGATPSPIEFLGHQRFAS